MAEIEGQSMEQYAPDTLYALPNEDPYNYQELEEYVPRSKRVFDAVKREKYKIGAGAILVGPFVAGLAQGLNPRDAFVYGVLQIATIGANESPDPELVRHMMHAAVSHNTPVALADFRKIEPDFVDTYKEFLKDAGILGILGKVFYDKWHGSSTRREAVRQGVVPIKPKGEQVIVLGGSHSYIADVLSSGNDRNHFVLVFENAEGGREALDRNRRKLKNNEPVYLNLAINHRDRMSYSQTNAWKRLKLSQTNLIHADNGKRYLMVVGCGEKADEELSLNKENVDVTQDDLRMAGDLLKSLLIEGDLIEGRRDLIDVYVGNAAIKRTNSDNLMTISDRELAKSNGVDIYIDTWGHVLRAIVDKVKEKPTTHISVATTQKHYREFFTNRFMKHIQKLPDCEQLRVVDGDAPLDDSTWIVYEGTSEETFLEARRQHKRHPEARIIALISNDKLPYFADKSGYENVEFVVASEIIANTIRGVRNELKEGKTPDEIQSKLDAIAPSLELEIEKAQLIDVKSSPDDDSMVCIFDTSTPDATYAY